jgi:predicted amidohydrolase
MKVAAIQHDIAWEDADTTRKHVAPMIAHAASAGARLIVLTEMYATGFSMNPGRVAEDPGGPNQQFLVEQAAEHGVWLIGSIAQWAEQSTTAQRTTAQGGIRRATNTAVVAGPAGELHRYDKIHPFSYADEHLHYQAGTQFLTVMIDGVLRPALRR